MADSSSSAVVATHRLPTNTTTRMHPVHRWMNFVAGFSPEFVDEMVSAAGLGPGDTLLDPFAGMATSLVAANHRGLDAVGYEPQPFFFDIGAAKSSTTDPASLDRVVAILDGLEPTDPGDVWGGRPLEFLTKLVDERHLSLLASARLRESGCEPAHRGLYRLVVTALLQGATGSKTDGIYKAPTTRKRSVDLPVTLESIVERVRQDLTLLAASPVRPGTSRIHRQSSERMAHTPDSSVDICVTSPPYLNNFDFAEMARMELYFWHYASSWKEITDSIRAEMIINTTTAPTVARRRQDFWAGQLSRQFLERVTTIRDDLASRRRERGGGKDYESLVFPYFAQMGSVIGEVHRCLRDGAPFHMVVSDAALYGVHIDTESLLADLMAEAGFRVSGIVRLRDRGTRWVLAKRQGSSRGLGEFHIRAVR